MLAPAAVATKDAPVMEVAARPDSDGRDMRVFEWLVAGVAFVATLLLALPR